MGIRADAKEGASNMATTQGAHGTDSRKPRSREELEALFNSPAVQDLVNESRDQVERGECVRIPISEITRRLRID